MQDSIMRPVETDLLVRNTIRELTRSGLAVIVPGGNGGYDLDSFTDGPFGQVFDRNIFDSGAIMVGAARSGLHERLFSCHGTRIDCFAWGENIMTTSATTNPPGGLNGYADGLTVPLFGGTSGASAIIAGTAIALQGMHRKRHGSFLAPAQLRTLLSEIQFNTIPAVADIGRIGELMPTCSVSPLKLASCRFRLSRAAGAPGWTEQTRGVMDVQILRPDDLLVVDVTTTGLELSWPGEGGGPDLEDESPTAVLARVEGSAATITLTLATQAFGEQAFFEATKKVVPVVEPPLHATPAAGDDPPTRTARRRQAARRASFSGSGTR